MRFEPLAGKADEFREELRRVVDESRQEPGCLGMQVFESLREPVSYAIHSQWADEAAFALHARMPHTVRFIERAKELLTHLEQGLMAREIASQTE